MGNPPHPPCRANIDLKGGVNHIGYTEVRERPVGHPDDGGGEEYGKDDDPERSLVVAGDLGRRPAQVGAEGDPVEVDEVAHSLAQVGETEEE